MLTKNVEKVKKIAQYLQKKPSTALQVAAKFNLGKGEVGRGKAKRMILAIPAQTSMRLAPKIPATHKAGRPPIVYSVTA